MYKECANFMKRRARILAIVLAVCIAFTALPLTAQAATKSYTDEQLASITDKITTQFYSYMDDAYKLSKDSSVATERLWSRVISNRSAVLSLRKTIYTDMKAAKDQLGTWLQNQGYVVDLANFKVTAPVTKQVGIATIIGDKSFKPRNTDLVKPDGTYPEMFDLNLTFTENESGKLVIGMGVKSVSWQTFCYNMSLGKASDGTVTADATQYLSYTSAYAYLNTFYSGTLTALKKYVSPVKKGYLKNTTWMKKLAKPLHVRNYTLRKTWMAARDVSAKDTSAKLQTRYHTGIDVWAKSGTKIYSMTAGTVTAVGYESISGNYVVVKDKYGYYWHYYHMKALSTFVKPGDSIKAGKVIGLVGSTGNSDRNHLHITVINQDCMFMNPYNAIKTALKK